MRLSSVYSDILSKSSDSLFTLGFQNQIQQHFLYSGFVIMMAEFKLAGNLMVALLVYAAIVEGDLNDIFDD